MAATSRLNVQPPIRTSNRVSLLTVADQRPWDDRLELGVSFESEVCAFAEARAESCEIRPADEKPITRPPEPVEFDSFYAVTGHSCSTLGTPGLANRILAQDPDLWGEVHAVRAGNALERCKAQIAEAEFWTGEQRTLIGCSGQGLVDVPAEGILGGGACVKPLQALMLIDDQLAAACEGDVVIHIPSGAMGAWVENNYIFWDSTADLWRTYSGHVVVPGSGYPGTGPSSLPAADPADASIWIYATTPVVYYESPANIYPSVNQYTNDVEAIAEKSFLFMWDRCVHLAVCVDLCV